MEIKNKKLSNFRAPNGSFYEQNDIDYLINSGYTEESALETLSKTEKYTKPLDEVSKKALGLFSKISGKKAVEEPAKVDAQTPAEEKPATEEK